MSETSEEALTGQNRTTPRRARAWYKAFLSVLSETANVGLASAAAGRSRSTVYEARDDDPDFAAAWVLAVEEATDKLLAVATERATSGWEEPVYQQGELIGTVRKFDNNLLWKIMGAHQPAIYGTKIQQDLTSDGKPVRVQVYLPENGSEEPSTDEADPPPGR